MHFGPISINKLKANKTAASMQTLTKNIFIRYRLAEIQNPPPGVVAVNKAPQVEIEGEDRVEKKKMK